MRLLWVVVLVVVGGCATEPEEVAAVGITGSWTGAIDDGGGVFCSLDQSLTEDTMGSVTGTAALSCPLGTEPLIVAGTNNTGGESNYLMLNYTWANAVPPHDAFTFNGRFDGVSAMSGLVNGSGWVDRPMSGDRWSIQPLPIPEEVHGDRAVPGENVFLPGN